MATIVAIGGGELRDLETLPIDKAIVKLAKKKCPKALFIPTASNDSLGYWQVFQDVYGKKLGCETDVLFLLSQKHTQQAIREKIVSADIIYVGGGNTLRMLKAWRKLGVDRLLRQAHQQGTILAGLSAGAICWFRYGSSDSRRFMQGKDQDVFMRVQGLNLVPCTISPHHIRERKLRNPGLVKIMDRTTGVALAVDDNAAILIQDDTYKILRSDKNAKIHKVFTLGGKAQKKVLPDTGVMSDLLKKK